MSQDLVLECDRGTGLVRSLRLYGHELLDASRPCGPELAVNGLPLRTRLHPESGDGARPLERAARLKGERFTGHFSGWGLVIERTMGSRANVKHPCFGVNYLIRREQADATDLPCPGPGGPPVEAPLFVDTFTLLNWNWSFWGDDTQMIFPSLHSNGPSDEFGHLGYEHDTPERCKAFLRNVWRRIYPGVMGIHGGVFHNARTGHWLAITCRRPHVGYILNTEAAGRGVGYDFTLHAPFGLGDSLTLPEVKLYYGPTAETMWSFMADYLGFYYREPPAWVFKTLWGDGLAWNNEATWTRQAEAWERRVASGEITGISYSLVTNRPVLSGTTPTGYEPDPNHGTREDFRAMCRRLADKGVPVLIWMSHSGLTYRGGADIDDDWFIYGIDGRTCASWGNADRPELVHINPGHPGYIEYTKKWIRFYMQECGAKGIWFDCLGWAFPPDYRPRSFMRYPGDTNRMAIRFMEEIRDCIKACDPEGVFGGEGGTSDASVDLLSLNSNPVRAADGLGPRDFMLSLNRWGERRFCIDQGPRFSAACGMARALSGAGVAEKNRCLARLLREKGGPRACTALPGDLGVFEAENMLVVPAPGESSGAPPHPEFRLPVPWGGVKALVEVTDGSRIARATDGAFRSVPAGVYRMEK